MAMMSTATPLCPDKRGGRRCVCHGTFSMMHRGSGWITPVEEIDHPSAKWNQGDVYLSEKDVPLGVTFQPGDSVVFYLYVDAKGLGAQNCVHLWTEEAKTMRAARSLKEMNASASAFLPCSNEIAIASAFLSAASVLQAPVMPSKPPPGLTISNLAVDLSSFYEDDEDDDDEEDSSACDTAAIKIRLADVLPEKEALSVGSVLHAQGTCKRCTFYPKGTCTNAADCEFCHLEHDKRPQNHKRKRLWRERQREKAQLARAEADRVAASLRTPFQEPMKISSFLMSMPQELSSLTSGHRTPPTSIDEGSAEEGFTPGTPKSSADEGSVWDSLATIERQPGRKPPPPNFPPPPMPE